MDVRFYLSLLLLRLHYIALFVVLGTAAGVSVAMILPPRYIAEARLVVESQQIPDELAASTVRMGAIEQLQIIRQRILARGTILDLADQFGLYPSVDGQALSPDEIVADMRSRIAIETSGGAGRRGEVSATLVDVRFSASQSQLAASVANEVVTQILQENVQMRTTVSGQTLDFFEREVERLDRELAQQNARVTRFQEENREALPESLEFRRSRLVALQERDVDIGRNLEQLRDRRRNLEMMFAQTGGLGTQSEAEMTDEARELKELRDRYASQATVLSEQNPRMRMLQTRIETLAATVARQAGAEPQSGVDGPRAAYELQLGDIDSQISFLEERRAGIQQEMDSLQRTIEATPNNATTLQSLLRDLDNTRAQYDGAVASRARAETGDTIEALSRGQRITVIENAVPPAQPNSPNRTLIAAAGFGGGLAIGLALVLLLELTNRAVRRASEIETALDVTPIVTLSYMRTRQEIFRRRLVIGGALIVAALGIPLGILAIDTYYRPVDLLVEDILQKIPFYPVFAGNIIGAL